MVILDFPYNPEAQQVLKGYPGVRFAPEFRKKWVGPAELTKVYKKVAEHFEYKLVNSTVEPFEFAYPVMNPKLHEYQRLAVNKALAMKSLLISFEQGLGKTLTAIETMRLSNAKRFLVVCPAGVRSTWRDELTKWWPDHPPAVTIKDGKTQLGEATIVIVSYGLMHVAPKTGWDFIVMDESHYIANAGTDGAKRARIAKELCDSNRDAYRLALSGTPVNTELEQMQAQLNWLWPGNGVVGRFGSHRQFCEAYMGKVPNEHRKQGYDYKGVNEGRIGEFNERLKSCMVRVTTKDLPDLVPPLHCKTIRLEPPKMNLTSMLDSFDYQAIIEAHGAGKVKEVARMACGDTLGGGHAIILTHTKATAKRLADELERLSVPCVQVSGDVPIAKRHKVLKAGLEQDRCVFVTTMHAIKEGINFLANIEHVYFAEYYWSPGVMSQVMKRFNRLNSKGAARVTFVIFKGSYEESVVQTLRHRLAAINQAYALSESEQNMQTNLEDNETDEDKRAFLSLVADGFTGDELEEEWTL